MARRRGQYQCQIDTATIVRMVVGLIWIAGALFNARVTVRMTDPYKWIAEGSPFRVHRWFFGEVVGDHPALWTVLLSAGEAMTGMLTLARGGWAKLGLAGGVVFSVFLFSFALPYTLVLGPYALVLGWLLRRDHAASLVDLALTGLRRRKRRIRIPRVGSIVTALRLLPALLLHYTGLPD